MQAQQAMDGALCQFLQFPPRFIGQIAALEIGRAIGEDVDAHGHLREMLLQRMNRIIEQRCFQVGAVVVNGYWRSAGFGSFDEGVDLAFQGAWFFPDAVLDSVAEIHRLHERELAREVANGFQKIKHDVVAVGLAAGNHQCDQCLKARFHHKEIECLAHIDHRKRSGDSPMLRWTAQEKSVYNPTLMTSYDLAFMTAGVHT